MATTRNDKLMYVVLVATIVAGLTTTLLGAAGGEEHNYRLTVSPWFRSIFVSVWRTPWTRCANACAGSSAAAPTSSR